MKAKIKRWGIQKYVAIKRKVIWATISKIPHWSLNIWEVQWANPEKKEWEFARFKYLKEAKEKALEIANAKI